MNLRGLLLLASGLLAASCAQAQQFDVAVSDAARCLTVKPGAAELPVFPPMQLNRQQGGAVKVQLEFREPDTEPRVTVQQSTGDEAFVQAVREHARDLRVPCLAAGAAPARLVREYVFPADSRPALATRAEDATAPEHREALKCVKHSTGRKSPDYPADALRGGLQGRVVAELRFDAPDRPPVATVHARPSAALFADEVLAWVTRLRMPCHPGGSVKGDWVFTFMLEGQGAYGFTEVTFRSLLGSTKGIRQQTLAFDTTTMGCPFDVRFTFRRPFTHNQVSELGNSDPARRPLLEWLETVDLELPRKSLDSVYGDTALITVPCLRLNLKPKE